MRWLAWLSRHRDPVIAALAFLGLSAELLAWDGADLPRALPLAVGAALPLYWRRTQPVPAFLATWLALVALTRTAPGFDNGSSTFVVIFFVSLFSLGAHTRGREIGAAVVLVAVGIAVFVMTDSDSASVGDVVFGIFFVGGPWATGLALRLRGDLARTHAQLKLEQEENTRRAIAEERATIARELHDVVAHAISVTVLQARGARRMLGRDEATVRRSLDAIEHTNTQALGDMRRLLALLRDTEGDADTSPQPSLERLDDLVDDVRESGLPVEVQATGDHRDVPPGVDLSAYRIIQEALTNVLKHAGPASATVQLDLRRGRPDPVGHGHRNRAHSGQRHRTWAGGDPRTGGGSRWRDRDRAGDGGGFVVRARLPYSVET